LHALEEDSQCRTSKVVMHLDCTEMGHMKPSGVVQKPGIILNVPKSCCRFFTLIIFWAVNALEVLQRQAKPKWKARSYYTIPSADTLASSIHIMRNQDVQCTVFQISLICNLPNHKFYQQFLSSIGGDAHRTWPFSRQQCEFDTHVEAAGTLCTTQHINDMRSSHFQERQASSLYVWLLSSMNPAPPWVPKYSKIIMRSCHLIDIGILGTYKMKCQIALLTML
jgi:hypothetical protein